MTNNTVQPKTNDPLKQKKPEPSEQQVEETQSPALARPPQTSASGRPPLFGKE